MRYLYSSFNVKEEEWNGGLYYSKNNKYIYRYSEDGNLQQEYIKYMYKDFKNITEIDINKLKLDYKPKYIIFYMKNGQPKSFLVGRSHIFKE
ncbi:MAG: hypothetical protein LBF97_06215 [Elusimicrobiota bacterium]|jgi:hypothetical protein|nr:hypothetical protein [Elusimicrobiota bacterium]